VSSVISHQSSVIGHWSLVIGHWSLVIGHWSLVIGHWSLVSLVIGHWSAVIGQRSAVIGQRSSGYWFLVLFAFFFVISSAGQFSKVEARQKTGEIVKRDPQSEHMAKILSFMDLEVWQVGRRIRRRIYEITLTFPSSERYNLAGQMRSAAVSMTSNIAEGFGRFFYKENKRSCLVSRGEAYELQDHILTSLDERYISQECYTEIDEELRLFLRLLNGYIRSIGKEGRER
jgi:four helix bundle protein